MNSTRPIYTMFAVVFALILTMGGVLKAYADEPPEFDAISIEHSSIYPVNGDGLFSILGYEANSNAPVLKDVRAVEQGRQTLLVKTWDVLPGYDPELLVEDDFERGGLFYKRAYVLLVSENFDTRRKLASEVVVVPHDRQGEALAKLQPIIEYSQDGYTGQLVLNTDAIVTETAGQSSYSYTVTDVREFSGLERNDPYLVPKTAEKDGVQLQLVDIGWSQARNGGYTATVSYRGTATGTITSSYITTATYVGEVSKNVLDSVTYAVVYEGSLIPPPPFDFSPYIIIGGGIVIALIAAAIILSRQDNTKVYAMIGKEYQLVHKQKLTSLSPIVDLSPREISGDSGEFMIVLSRLALRKLRGHNIKIIGTDNVMKEQRIYKTRHFRIGRGTEEEYEQ